MKQAFVAFVLLLTPMALLMIACSAPPSDIRTTEDFGKNWKFHLGDVSNGQDPAVDDSGWRRLRLPHDWSIEGEFSAGNPAGHNGGALPGGIGWYRKSFNMPASDSSKLVFIEFDGVYRNSEVWINGHYLGKRPYGYSSFRYELTPFLKYGSEPNSLAVKVDNSRQPNSRWYSGSGIYRNVWLVRTEKLHVDHRGTSITTSDVSTESATVSVSTRVRNRFPQDRPLRVITALENEAGETVARAEANCEARGDSVCEIAQTFMIRNPDLWSIEHPRLMRAITRVEHEGQVFDEQTTTFGIRDVPLRQRQRLRPQRAAGQDQGRVQSPRPRLPRGCGQPPGARTPAGNPEGHGGERYPHVAQSTGARASGPLRQDGLRRDGRGVRHVEEAQDRVRLFAGLGCVARSGP